MEHEPDGMARIHGRDVELDRAVGELGAGEDRWVLFRSHTASQSLERRDARVAQTACAFDDPATIRARDRRGRLGDAVAGSNSVHPARSESRVSWRVSPSRGAMISAEEARRRDAPSASRQPGDRRER